MGELEKDRIQTLLSLMLAHAQDIRVFQVKNITEEEYTPQADSSWVQFNAEHKELWNMLLSPPSDASPTQPVHPLSDHQIWIEGMPERAAGYLLKVHDLSTGEQITTCKRIELVLEPRHSNTAILTLYRNEIDATTETVTVQNPTVSLTAYVHDVREEERI